uniref:NADAR domain-containing protein n=1 Tax=Meloidogyne enterolobii TaxID=390850 RepID=A0A6V7VYJ8_MELEN|nr:unnamed protein product [Meloidogyne enterolobii]
MSIIPFYSTTKKYSELSNFHLAQIKIDGKSFPSTENYYQFVKATTLGAQLSDINKICSTTPSSSKSMAQNIEQKATLAQINLWQSKKITTMQTALLAKFTQHPPLLKLLLDTSDKILVEASKSDAFWGASASEETIIKTGNWRGLNILGKMLMEIRKEFTPSLSKQQKRAGPSTTFATEATSPSEQTSTSFSSTQNEQPAPPPSKKTTHGWHDNKTTPVNYTTLQIL